MTLIAKVFPELPSPKKVIIEMSVKSRFRGQFNNKHTKTAQRLLKSPQHYLYHIFDLCEHNAVVESRY